MEGISEEQRFTLDMVVEAGDIDRFAALSGDHNPLHMDAAFAQRHGFTDRVAHSGLLMKHDVEWYSFLRCQYLDDETARMMVDAGCRGVYLGVESASDVVLKNMNKRATRAEFVRGAGLLSKHGIPKMVAFVLGFPGETEATVRENEQFLQEVEVEFYTLKEFYYMENTGVHLKREEYGLTGMGSEWSHATMDYATATAHKLRMFTEIESSVFVDPDISLWHLIYMEDQGFSLQEIQALQRATNDVMKSQLLGQFDDAHPAFDRLKQMLAGRTKLSLVSGQ